MNPFDYSRTTSDREAMATVVDHGSAAFLAGGTTKLDLMRQYVETNDRLIDINGLPWREIQILSTPQGEMLRIGALARMSQVADDAKVKQGFPAISEALLLSASPQVRNMASIGGNLMQRTRCPYFREPAFTACNKRSPGSGCAAIAGENREHAVLGTSEHCIATHASDLAVALVALDAVVVTHGPTGMRRIPLEQFHVLPGATPHIECVLQRGELIAAVDVPMVAVAKRSHYLKVRDRASYEFALTSAAVGLVVVNGIVQQVRIAMGGVGTKPWRCHAAEAALTGRPATAASFATASHAAVEGAQAQSQNGFKIELGRRTIVRALIEVAGGDLVQAGGAA